MDYSRQKTEHESLKTTISSMTVTVTELKTEVSNLQIECKNSEKRYEEERKSNAEMFNELYNSRNKTNDTLVELSTTLKMLVSNVNQQFYSLDKKIDELKNRKE